MKKILGVILFLLIGQNILLAQVYPPFWPEILAFKKQDSSRFPPKRAILFIGSSSFARWNDVNNYFPDYTIVNRGFGGSTLVDAIRYTYDIILPYQPKQVVIYCGENDLSYPGDISAAEVVLRVKTLFGMIRTNLPDTRIDYISMKPSPSREKIQGKVRAANKEIKAFFETQENATFIDIYAAMLDENGKMREDLYEEDRLHMNQKGYTIWEEIILPYLVK
ncbi:MAG: GDSL-type esterase/lipase family protein [Bacteroidales bacterium]